MHRPPFSNGIHHDSILQAYLLGRVEIDKVLHLQKTLIKQVSQSHGNMALILCEHPPGITVGREGSTSHILYDPEELQARRWPVKWLNRGGGCQLHLPGQIALYCIAPLRQIGLGVQAFLERLQLALCDVLEEHCIRASLQKEPPAILVGERQIATMGVAIQDWISSYGAILNVSPDLTQFRWVNAPGSREQKMTSIARERGGPVDMALARQRILEQFAQRFGLSRTTVFSSHPALA